MIHRAGDAALSCAACEPRALVLLDTAETPLFRLCRKWHMKAFWYGEDTSERQSVLFRGRHFREEIIVLCLRWYLPYPLKLSRSRRNDRRARGALDHSAIARGVLRYAPALNERIGSKMRPPTRSWRSMDIPVPSPIDSAGNTIDFLLSPRRDFIADRAFLQLAIA